ncbi:hypothetical protein B0I35DRAFT_322048, partial [Stachybotrys elegans]
VAFFCAQAAAPDEEYLRGLHSFLSHNAHGQLLLREISNLKDGGLLSTLISSHKDVGSLQGLNSLDGLHEWAAKGSCGPLAGARSGISALPLLVIIQVGQYLRYLEFCGLTHRDFLANVGKGGLQGFCGGLATAMAISCATDETAVVQHAATALRVLIAVAAYGEAADEGRGASPTTIAIRLQYEGQAEDITQCFPGTYVSAVTGPLSVSVSGPSGLIEELLTYVRNEEQLQALIIDVRGRLHSPENSELAASLCKLCHETPSLQLPDATELQVPVRSNISGQRLTNEPLTAELITAILASKSQWHTVLVETATYLKKSGVDAPTAINFGLTDVISIDTFFDKGLRMTKTLASKLIIPLGATETLYKEFSYPENAVAIIGASARLPGARNLDEMWELLCKGEDRHEPLRLDRFNLYDSYRVSQSSDSTKARRYYGNFIDGIDQFDNAFFGINAREMVNMDPQQRMLLEAAYEAMESCGYTRTHVWSRGDPVGCFIGASFIEYLENTSAHPPAAYTAPGTIRAFLCGRLSYYFGWTGPAEVIDTACSASLVAINRAVRAIQSGECSLALSGGVNLITGINNFLDLGRAGFLSPTGQCKPFDKSGDGYCRSDGLGLVVLKSLKQAQLDGDSIMGVIVGAATNQGGLSESITSPSSDAQIKLYKSLLQQAAIQPEQVTYVEAHGTGTQVGDPLEVRSLRNVFGNSSRQHLLQIGSIKGSIGHCETAAGVAGLLKVICMLTHGAIPPQASHKVLNPKIPSLSPDRMAISTELTDWNVPFRAALVNSYGAAGSNAAILCCEAPKKADPLQDAPNVAGSKWPFILSAKSTTSLERIRNSLVDYMKKRPQLSLASVARTLSERRQRHKDFVVFEASDVEGLISSLENGDGTKPRFRHGTSRSVVLTFGGQSKQTIDLDRNLYEQSSSFRAALDSCDSILRELGYPSIFPAVFVTASIQDIVVLQAGFVAVQYAMATTWIKAGLKVDAVIGHSLGELTALAVSGKVSIRDCLKLVAARADLMKSKWGQEKGCMLAVFASVDTVRDRIAGLDLDIACYNSDTSQVVSGDKNAMAELETRLSSQSPPIRSLRIDTSHAFHSRLVDPILNQLDKVTASTEWKKPTIPIELCTETSTDPTAPYSLSHHARNPVFLVNAGRRLEQKLGPCVFLEAGMNTPIMSMMKRAVARAESHTFVSISSTDEVTGFNLITRTACTLWEACVDVTHWRFAEEDCGIEYAWLPPYQFDRTTGWLEHVDRAAVLQSQLSLGTSSNQQTKGVVGTARMIELLPNLKPADTTQRFRVLTSGVRWQQIVAAHAVRDRPLCPASLYLECVAMALDISAKNPKSTPLEFRDLAIQVPLGLSAKVVEVLVQEAGAETWKFQVMSRDTKEVLHAKGCVTLSAKTKTDTTARLFANFAGSLANDADAEKIKSRRLYNLFSRVVTYAPILRGVSDITISGTKAMANIMSPNGDSGAQESTALRTSDAVTLDSFIQVVGLLINSSEMVGEKEVMVCSGIDNSTVAQGVDLSASQSWKVYASYTAPDSSHALGDVFAYAPDGSFAASLAGCRFSKIEITKLERLLDPSSKSPSEGARQLPPQQPSVIPAPVLELKSPQPIWGDAVRQTLAVYTGLASDEMMEDAVLGDLGLDSIAAIEMAEELQSSYQILVNGPDLLNMTVKQLEDKMTTSNRNGLPARVSTLPAKVPMVSTKGLFEPVAPQHTVRQTLEVYTGLKASEIPSDSLLGDLGLDSIAAIEMAEELQTSHDICISGPDLLNLSLKEL